MTPAGKLLAQEISRNGPIPFERFMEVALYHPAFGYYSGTRDPFGKDGDYYTAEQLQPVFGRAIAAYLRSLGAELGVKEKLTVVELGAGRREMSPEFAGFEYIPVDVLSGSMPDAVTGVVFSNEFFDALPVNVAVSLGGQLREMRVDYNGNRFVWTEGPPVSQDAAKRAGPVPEGGAIEMNTAALRWLDRIASRLKRGYVLTIDYGYLRKEAKRFPAGTLMSYRRHQALEDVLAEPGERDITSHVCFTDLQEHGEKAGLVTARYESLAQMLLRIGGTDQFAAILQSETEARTIRHRMQLKTLLFGMGETFRVLLQRKERGPNENGPEGSGPRRNLDLPAPV